MAIDFVNAVEAEGSMAVLVGIDGTCLMALDEAAEDGVETDDVDGTIEVEGLEVHGTFVVSLTKCSTEKSIVS